MSETTRRITATPTEDPERQALTVDLVIGEPLDVGVAVLDTSGRWNYEPFLTPLSIEFMRDVIATLAAIPRPSREEMEPIYRARGYLAADESLEADWGVVEP